MGRSPSVLAIGWTPFRVRRRAGLDPAVSGEKYRHLRSVTAADLAEDALEFGLHGFLGNHEEGRDLAVRPSVAHEAKNLQLSRGQSRLLTFRVPLLPFLLSEERGRPRPVAGTELAEDPLERGPDRLSPHPQIGGDSRVGESFADQEKDLLFVVGQ